MTSVPFGRIHCEEANRAFLRFGKGRHPPASNLGDCHSHAPARIAEEPLLRSGVG